MFGVMEMRQQRGVAALVIVDLECWWRGVQVGRPSGLQHAAGSF